MSKVMLQAVY